jgi:hypothetical protein
LAQYDGNLHSETENNTSLVQKIKNIFKIKVTDILNIQTIATEFMDLTFYEMQDLAGLGNQIQQIKLPDITNIQVDDPNAKISGEYVKNPGQPTDINTLNNLIQQNSNNVVEIIRNFTTKDGKPLSDEEQIKELLNYKPIKDAIILALQNLAKQTPTQKTGTNP